MNIREAEAVISAANSLNLEVGMVREYSGRGMMGVKTMGVSVSSPRERTADIIQRAAIELGRPIENLRWDSLGHSMIYY